MRAFELNCVLSFIVCTSTEKEKDAWRVFEGQVPVFVLKGSTAASVSRMSRGEQLWRMKVGNVQS